MRRILSAARELRRCRLGRLVARNVEGRQDGRREDHPHHLPHRVGRVDAIDPELGRQVEGECRLAGSAGAADVEDERPRQPSQAPDEPVAPGDIGAFLHFEKFGDALRQMPLLQAGDLLVDQPALQLLDATVGVVEVQARARPCDSAC